MKQLLYLLFCVQFSAFGQCDTTAAVDFPVEDAEYPGRPVEMKRFIVENMIYPEIELCSLGQFTGRIYLRFIVCADGSIYNIECERGSGDKEIDQNAIDLIKKMPNWVPAKDQNGKPVNSFVRLPIIICLQ